MYMLKLLRHQGMFTYWL